MSTEERTRYLRSKAQDQIKVARKLRRAVGIYCRAMEDFYSLNGRFRMYVDESGATPIVHGWLEDRETIH